MDFRTYLEDMMVVNHPCSIRFRADNGAVATIEARITDLYRDNEEEFIMTDRGIRIRLEDLRSVGDRTPDMV
ncbi:MAG: hypothetical protein ACJ75F_03070 [Flavisolibacter sp.]